MCVCCSPKCLKIFIFIGCLIITGIGAVLIWGGYELLSFVILKSLQYTFVGYIFIGCGSGFVFLSLLGFLGAWKEIKCLLAFYIIFSSILGIILLALGVGLLYARNLASGYMTETSCSSYLSAPDEACVKAGDVLCHIYCPCKAQDSNYIFSFQQKNATITNQLYVYSNAGATNILECDPCYQLDLISKNVSSSLNSSGVSSNAYLYSSLQYAYVVDWLNTNLRINVNASTCNVTANQYKDQYFDKNLLKFFPILTWIENSFSCSGLCTTQRFYLFSDVGKGQPGGTCRKQLNDWIQLNFLIFGILGIIFGLCLIFIDFLSCTLCCCKKTKQKNAQVSDDLSSKGLVNTN